MAHQCQTRLREDLPLIGPRSTPPDDDVRPWAASKEPDPLTRLFILMDLQFGWRPVYQIGHLRWRNPRYDARRMPVALIARGDIESFKTWSGTVAHLPKDVSDALSACKP